MTAAERFRIELAHRAAAIHLEGREFALDAGGQKAARAHAQRARDHHTGGLAHRAVLLEHRAEMHGKVGRFAVRDVRQKQLPLDGIARGAGGRPQLRVFAPDGVELRIVHADLFAHAQQHGPQMREKVLAQCRVAGKVHAQTAFHLADERFHQMVQLHLARTAPLFAVRAGDIRRKILL